MDELSQTLAADASGTTQSMRSFAGSGTSGIPFELYSGETANLQLTEARTYTVSRPVVNSDGTETDLEMPEPVLEWHGTWEDEEGSGNAILVFDPNEDGSYDFWATMRQNDIKTIISPLSGDTHSYEVAMEEHEDHTGDQVFAGELEGYPAAEMNAEAAEEPEFGVLSAPGVKIIDILFLKANGVSVSGAVYLADLNQAFMNSGMAIRAKITYERGVNYNQTANMSNDLRSMHNHLATQYNNIRTWRRNYRADLVAMIVPSTAPTDGVSSACGVAYIPPTSGNKWRAYSVTAASCGSETFVHEIGHNLGASHDFNNATGGCLTYEYSCGWRRNGIARDIMSYQCPINCPRQLQFASPLYFFLNAPGERSGREHRDARRAINNMVPKIWPYYARFNDVNPSTALSRAVYWLVDVDVTGGVTDTQFQPSSSSTRAHVSTFLYRMAGEPSSPLGAHFTDVSSGAYYSRASRWMRGTGISLGCTTTTFCPNDPITRSQITVMLYRFSGSPTVSNDNHGYTDVERGTERARAVMWAKTHGIVPGTSSTLFSPNANVNRGQLSRFLDDYADTPGSQGSGHISLGVTRPANTW